MKKLIYLEDAIDTICKKCKADYPDTSACDICDDISVLKSLPSAEPEIIRCKDCKHYKLTSNRAFGLPVKHCEWTGFEDVDDDDFCSRAERKENR